MSARDALAALGCAVDVTTLTSPTTGEETGRVEVSVRTPWRRLYRVVEAEHVDAACSAALDFVARAFTAEATAALDALRRP